LSRRPGRVVSILALLLLVTGCSSFRSKPSVSVKSVPANLVFGAPQATPSPSPATRPSGQATVAPLPTPSITPAPPSETPRGPPASCEPANPFPNEPATPDITRRPVPGAYEFAYKRSAGKAVRTATGFRHVSNVQAETVGPQTVGFSYTVRDGFTGQRAVFVVRTDQTAPGFYLRAIGLPRGGEEFVVQPQPMLQILAFPLQPRNAQSARGADLVTGTVVTSAATVQDREPEKDRVRACHAVADAWRVHWTIDLTGQVSQTWNGTFWFATQWGGWPIADNVAMSGSLLTATVRSTIRRLEPRAEAG
jgi:hypothetical protein